MNENRIFRNTIESNANEATYIMSSSFRLNDNHSLEYLIKNYKKRHIILLYVHEKNQKNVDFILPYLLDIQKLLQIQDIKTTLLDCSSKVIDLLRGDVILDKEYLKEKQILELLVQSKGIPHIVFEDNVTIPVEVVSNKEEYSARTIRSKIHKHLYNFIDPINLFPSSKGEIDALNTLDYFLENSLRNYEMRNHPEFEYTSNLSPYLKYGLISPVRILFILDSIPSLYKDSFIEELLVRRELSYNFVHFNHNYDNFNKITYEWAYSTMNAHLFDKREYLYTIEDYIQFRTHDPYFNAAMKEMVLLGKMHGYMRMYWCKKIIEWSPSYEVAYNIAITLNNNYFLDGNTPNGYAGVAWCFGKHDRAWKERPIFGKLRYMNSNGLKRKFDIASYVDRIEREVN